ncbi:MAG TPA: histidine kinase, partial [Herpetosiphonaceae bacterium]
MLQSLWRQAKRAEYAVFALIMLIVFAGVFAAPSRPRGWPLAAAVAALGLAYALLGTYGSDWVHERRGRPLIIGYVTVQLALQAAFLYLTEFASTSWLITMPFIGEMVFLLRRRWAALVYAALTGLMVFGGWRFADGQGAVWTGIVNYIAALAFVVAFTTLLARERSMRSRIEQLAAELGAANGKLRDYALQAEELATTKERNRLAREIHDSLGHYLTVVNVQIEAAGALLEREPARAREALAKAQAGTREGLGEIRRSVAALRAPERGSLAEQLARLAEEARATGLAVTLDLDGAARPLPPPVEHALFRAAQEGLTNARKYAAASRIELALDYGDPAQVRLLVADDGVGSAAADGG